jgi:hypothetical protein
MFPNHFYLKLYFGREIVTARKTVHVGQRKLSLLNAAMQKSDM